LQARLQDGPDVKLGLDNGDVSKFIDFARNGKVRERDSA
jgi:hypothetical protein